MSTEIPQSVIDAFVGAAHGDFDTVKSLLAEYPTIIRSQAAWDESAIQAAAQMGRVDIAETLLAAGAPLDICTAAMLGRVSDVQNLLDQDPTLIHALGAHGIPLIYFPIIMGNRSMSDYLFGRGCSLDGGEGVSTPMHGAVRFNQMAMLAWLLENGARTDLKDANGNTALQVTRLNQNEEMIHLLETRTPACFVSI